MTRKLSRRTFAKALSIATTALTVPAVLSGTASAHVEDPYADVWEPAHSANYNNASRGGGSIDWVVIHVGEGGYSSIVNWFQNSSANVSAHYVIRNSDGYAAQMVHHADIAWHAGGQNYNDYSVGIEHGGYTGETNFTNALYQKSANIVGWLCEQYDIPKVHPSGVAPCDASTDGGVIGHHQVPEADCGPNNHTDPGSTWNWDYYMDLVGGTNNGDGDGSISMDDRVVVTAGSGLNTRYRPGLESRVLKAMPQGTVGKIMNGPVDEDGYTWWGVHWLEDDIWGWSVERYLDTV